MRLMLDKVGEPYSKEAYGFEAFYRALSASGIVPGFLYGVQIHGDTRKPVYANAGTGLVWKGLPFPDLLAEHEVTRLISLVRAIAEKHGIEADGEELAELERDVAPEAVAEGLKASKA